MLLSVLERNSYYKEVNNYCNKNILISKIELIKIFDDWVAKFNSEKKYGIDIYYMEEDNDKYCMFYYDMAERILHVEYADRFIKPLSEVFSTNEMKSVCINSFNRHFNLSIIKNVWFPKSSK